MTIMLLIRLHLLSVKYCLRLKNQHESKMKILHWNTSFRRLFSKFNLVFMHIFHSNNPLVAIINSQMFLSDDLLFFFSFMSLEICYHDKR